MWKKIAKKKKIVNICQRQVEKLEHRKKNIKPNATYAKKLRPRANSDYFYDEWAHFISTKQKASRFSVALLLAACASFLLFYVDTFDVYDG